MYFIYILYSLKDKKLYVGRTDSLTNRLIKHNGGLVKSTKSRRPLTMIYSEFFNTRGEAMKREKYFKGLYSTRFKQKILKQYLKSNIPG